MTMLTGWLRNSFHSAYNHNAGFNVCSYIFMQTRNYAARKGTREKARKKKAKAVIEKVTFVLKNRKEQEKRVICPLDTINDSWKKTPIDNVWIQKYHKKPVYSLEEAIKFHREMHDPTMLNSPDQPLKAFVQLNMRRTGKKKFLEKFSKVVHTPHVFNYGKNEKTILAFCKDIEEQEKAKNAGADFVGGLETIKLIQNGKFLFKEYDHILAHVDIVTNLLLVRGLLKRKFPNIKAGTLGNDMDKLVPKFKYGIHYSAVPHEVFKEYGEIDVIFGLLSMDIQQLKDNFQAVISDIESMKPNSEGFFIQRVQVESKCSEESFIIDLTEYLPKIVEEPVEEPVEEENTAIISTN